MKKTIYFSLICLFLSFSALADDDTKKKPGGNLKECWEGFNKATFSLNQTLDGILFEPLAKGYRHIPSPIRKGTGKFCQTGYEKIFDGPP